MTQLEKLQKELLMYKEIQYQKLLEQRIKDDCQYFIENMVYIIDRDSEEFAIKFKLWFEQKQVLLSFLMKRLNIVLKARQLGLTWLALAFSVWNLVFKQGYEVVGLSKTEDDAKELVLRIVFILRHLPPWLIREKIRGIGDEGLQFEFTTMSVTILHPDNKISIFKSFTAGADSSRSFTANLVLIDEWAFQQFAKEIWSAAYPTINRPTGGKVIGLSTAKRFTFFQDMWNDATKGNNSFNPIFLGWRVDPRRDVDWYENSKKNMKHNYKSEYPNTPEEAFACAEGTAFPEFSREIHVCKPFEIPEYWSKWRSCDNGYTDPFAWYWFAVSDDGVVYIYREYTRNKDSEKNNYSDQAKKVIELSKEPNISITVCGHDAWNVHHLTITPTTPHGKSLIDYYSDGGLWGCVRAVTDRALRKITWHEYLKPYLDGNTNKLTARVQIFDTCTYLIDTLPELVCDDHDNEKVAECSTDHFFDGAGYGLVYQHSKYSTKPKKSKKKKLIDVMKPKKKGELI